LLCSWLRVSAVAAISSDVTLLLLLLCCELRRHERLQALLSVALLRPRLLPLLHEARNSLAKGDEAGGNEGKK
jgi:hypothetical protein